jgi:hypothetical protein
VPTRNPGKRTISSKRRGLGVGGVVGNGVGFGNGVSPILQDEPAQRYLAPQRTLMTSFSLVTYSASASIVLAYLETAAHSMVNSPF